MTLLQGRDIVLLASAPWEADGLLNCHHIARRLAADNRVLFVESTGLRAPNLFHRQDVLKILRRAKGRIKGGGKGAWKVGENLHVLPAMARLSPGGLPWRRLGRWLFARSCKRAAEALGFRRPVLWSFLPVAGLMLGRLGECAVIYHCVDDYAGNPGTDSAEVERMERELAARADLCLATSRPLAERLAAMGAKVRCVPNVAEVERFAGPGTGMPAEMAGLPRPIIGYTGNIASYKVDLDLLAEIARMKPGWSVALVGQVGGGDPGTRLGALAGLKNVHALGPKPYEKIPEYVRGFDVCVIPFRRNRVTEGSLPLKTFEYLAAGKPVVSRPLAALTAEPLEDVIYYAEDAAGFVAAIERSLAEGAEKRRKRVEIAGRYSWETRFPEISAYVAEAVARKETGGER